PPPSGSPETRPSAPAATLPTAAGSGKYGRPAGFCRCCHGSCPGRPLERGVKVSDADHPFNRPDLGTALPGWHVGDPAVAAADGHVSVEVPVLDRNGDLGARLVLLLEEPRQKRIRGAVVFERDGDRTGVVAIANPRDFAFGTYMWFWIPFRGPLASDERPLGKTDDLLAVDNDGHVTGIIEVSHRRVPPSP